MGPRRRRERRLTASTTRGHGRASRIAPSEAAGPAQRGRLSMIRARWPSVSCGAGRAREEARRIARRNGPGAGNRVGVVVVAPAGAALSSGRAGRSHQLDNAAPASGSCAATPGSSVSLPCLTRATESRGRACRDHRLARRRSVTRRIAAMRPTRRSVARSPEPRNQSRGARLIGPVSLAEHAIELGFLDVDAPHDGRERQDGAQDD